MASKSSGWTRQSLAIASAGARDLGEQAAVEGSQVHVVGESLPATPIGMQEHF